MNIVWQTDDGTLANADAFELLATVPDGAVDMVLCDLPYGTTRNKWDSTLDLARLWPELTRVTKTSAAIVLFAQTPFDKVLGCSRLDLLRYEWIWEKGKATGHLNAKRAPLKAHENLLVFYRELPAYNPQKEAAAQLLSPREHKPKGVTNYGVVHGGDPWVDNGTRYPRSVVRFTAVRGQDSLHPTQKPVDLCRYLIRTYTAPGQTVLDMTCGVATTAVAALTGGRRFICGDSDPGYAALGAKRLDAVQRPLVEAA